MKLVRQKKTNHHMISLLCRILKIKRKKEKNKLTDIENKLVVERVVIARGKWELIYFPL